MEDRKRIAILMGPSALVLLLLFVLPLIIMAVFTFRAGTFGAARETFTLASYAEFFSNSSFLRSLWRSTMVAFVVSALAVVLAYPLAYYLVFRAGPRRVTLLTILIIPAWTSYLLRILAWRLILGSNGVLNSVLLALGIVKEASPILLYSMTAVTITLTYVWVPFVALPIFASLERINRSVLEAAADLGCAPWQAFLRVTLPLSLPGVLGGFFFAFIPTLGEYVTPLLVGGAKGVMYGNLIQDQFIRALNWPLGSIMSLAMLVVALIAMTLFLRVVRLSDLVEM